MKLLHVDGDHIRAIPPKGNVVALIGDGCEYWLHNSGKIHPGDFFNCVRWKRNSPANETRVEYSPAPWLGKLQSSDTLLQMRLKMMQGIGSARHDI